MSWMQQLYSTYEACIQRPDFQEGEGALLPIYHSSQQAHVQVILDQNSNFIDATFLGKEETIIPVTEESAGRAGAKDAPHPLSDKLQYCAGDYADFGGKKKPFFDSYHAGLKAWCDSVYCHPKVKIIFEYIRKRTLIADLVKKGVLLTNEEGSLLDDVTKDESSPKEVFKVLQKDPSTKKYDQGNIFIWLSSSLK